MFTNYSEDGIVNATKNVKQDVSLLRGLNKKISKQIQTTESASENLVGTNVKREDICCLFW